MCGSFRVTTPFAASTRCLLTSPYRSSGRAPPTIATRCLASTSLHSPTQTPLVCGQGRAQHKRAGSPPVASAVSLRCRAVRCRVQSNSLLFLGCTNKGPSSGNCAVASGLHRVFKERGNLHGMTSVEINYTFACSRNLHPSVRVRSVAADPLDAHFFRTHSEITHPLHFSGHARSLLFLIHRLEFTLELFFHLHLVNELLHHRVVSLPISSKITLEFCPGDLGSSSANSVVRLVDALSLAFHTFLHVSNPCTLPPSPFKTFFWDAFS